MRRDSLEAEVEVNLLRSIEVNLLSPDMSKSGSLSPRSGHTSTLISSTEAMQGQYHREKCQGQIKKCRRRLHED